MAAALVASPRTVPPAPEPRAAGGPVRAVFLAGAVQSGALVVLASPR
ncbi:hypothetical protein [Streptomyces sp. NPDC059894]